MSTNEINNSVGDKVRFELLFPPYSFPLYHASTIKCLQHKCFRCKTQLFVYSRLESLIERVKNHRIPFVTLS